MKATTEPPTVSARSVRSGLASLIDPGASDWDKADEAVIPLEATPLDSQPSVYVRAAWANRPRGRVTEVRVRSLASPSTVAFRLEWSSPRPVRSITDVDVFADACAVLFPANGTSAELATMGDARQPVEGWHWRAGTETPFQITAQGLGTVDRAKEHEVIARANYAESSWQVVLARPRSASGVDLTAADIPVAFAIWSGAVRERAGLKSYSPVWHRVQLEKGKG